MLSSTSRLEHGKACREWWVDQSIDRVFINWLEYFSIVLSRLRKNKCDSARPICGGCVARKIDCHYESTPRRRGRDKRPRTRANFTASYFKSKMSPKNTTRSRVPNHLLDELPLGPVETNGAGPSARPHTSEADTTDLIVDSGSNKRLTLESNPSWPLFVTPHKEQGTPIRTEADIDFLVCFPSCLDNSVIAKPDRMQNSDTIKGRHLLSSDQRDQRVAPVRLASGDCIVWIILDNYLLHPAERKPRIDLAVWLYEMPFLKYSPILPSVINARHGGKTWLLPIRLLGTSHRKLSSRPDNVISMTESYSVHLINANLKFL